MAESPRPLYPRPPRSRARRAATLLLVNAGLFLGILVIVEGLSSMLIFSWDALHANLNAGLRHMRYDPMLGWATSPGLDIPDMYGPGVYLRTNSDGFRGEREYTQAVPPGKRRVICSGDSVTFGQGVDDLHSWCRLLESLDQRLETVIIAAPGHGIDQTYLWYKRDAARLQHHVHLFAPIVDDFRRMQFVRAYGFGKPVLALESGQLAVKNVPVPEGRYRAPWLTQSLQAIDSLRLAQALRRLDWMPSASHAAPGNVSTAQRAELDSRTEEIVPAVLADLKRLNEARSSILVVVLLPNPHDRDRPDTLRWRTVLERECRMLGIPFLNLADEFEQFSDEEVAQMYVDRFGHYSVSGNQYMARQIYGHLSRIRTASQALLISARRH